MPKANIHPKWYPEAEVYCEGKLILKIGSTKPKINVDVWSGTQRIIDTEGRVERFLRKYKIEKPSSD
eukprot:jgi/Galph1/4613/GphlegSOOS_G3259.1